MPRRGRWLYPLKCTTHSLLVRRCPWIVSTLRTVSKCEVHNVEEIHKAECTLVRTITAYNIPSQECVRVVEITTRHPSLSQKVLRHERQVHSDEELEKVCLPMIFRILTSSEFAHPKVKSCKDSSYCTHTLYIVEVCYYIVCIMLCYIYSCICQYNTCKTSNSKLYLESLSKKHRSSKPQRTTINSS